MSSASPETFQEKLLVEVALTAEQSAAIGTLDIRDRVKDALAGQSDLIGTVIANAIREKQSPKLNELRALGKKGVVGFDAFGNFLAFLPDDVVSVTERQAFAFRSDIKAIVTI